VLEGEGVVGAGRTFPEGEGEDGLLVHGRYLLQTESGVRGLLEPYLVGGGLRVS
jgi:hypothetical protein